MASQPKATMWRGGTSSTLHYPDPDGPSYRTACGELIPLDPGPVPNGTYTNCPRCRSALGL